MTGVVAAAVLVAFAVFLLLGGRGADEIPGLGQPGAGQLGAERLGAGQLGAGQLGAGLADGDQSGVGSSGGRAWKGQRVRGPRGDREEGASGAARPHVESPRHWWHRGRLGRRLGHPAADGRGAADAASTRHADEAEVCSALALLALAYRSGLPTWDVLDAVADGLTGAAAADLRQVATALRWGATESEAWGSVGPMWAPAARAVAVAHQAGVPPGSMLLAASDDLRAAELARLEVAAAKVGVRLVAPLGLVLLPAFCLTTVAPLVIALAGDLLTSRG